MSKVKTRVRVEESADGIQYIAQYKHKFLGIFEIWMDFDNYCKGDELAAMIKAESLRCFHMKERAEAICNAYHEIKNKPSAKVHYYEY